MKKLNIEFIRKEFEKEGYELLTKVYEGSKQKLDYICSSPEKHRHSVSWANWNSSQKVRCPYCVGTGKPTIEHIREDFAKKGYTLLTKTYENNRQKLEYICKRGHRHHVDWRQCNSKRKPKCPYCYGNAKLNIEFIRAEFAKEGYILLTKIYKNAHQKLKYICPKGHHHSITWNKWNSKRKQRCPFCNKSGKSKWEKTVKNFLGELNINYVPNDRTQLVNPNTGRLLELDIWIPNLNKAIECNGLYWHSRKQVSKNDRIKQQLCKDQNIDLLVITDKEWNDNTDKCKAKLISFVEAGD